MGNSNFLPILIGVIFVILLIGGVFVAVFTNDRIQQKAQDSAEGIKDGVEGLNITDKLDEAQEETKSFFERLFNR